jgi:hypothetical protein
MSGSSFITNRGEKVLLALIASGALGFATGLYFNAARTWASLLQNAFFFLTLALGAFVFIAINRVANAGWDTAIRRVPEAMMSYLPIGSVATLAIYFGRDYLYEGLRSNFGYGNNPMVFKNAWLSTSFFFARMAVFLGVWLLLAFLIKRESRKQDEDGELRHTRRIKRYSAIFLGVFGLTFTLASFDWLMSIEPLFYSTIYAFYVISGLLLSAFASITILAVVLRRRGLLAELNDEHLHKLGKLVLGFSTFWAYIWLSQYLLIYYANLPEETIYYIRRLQTPGWKFFFFANIFLNWLIPFALLLPRSVKNKDGWLLTACGIVLLGHWIDLYVMIFPAFEHSARLSLVDIAVLMGFASLFVQSFANGLRRSALIPRHDPYLKESLWQEPGEAPDPRKLSSVI